MRRWLCCVWVLLAACDSVARKEAESAKEARWKSVEVSSPSDHMVWQLTLFAVQSQGYPLAAGTDPGGHQVVSGWKTDMQPFRGEGVRKLAMVRITPIEKGRWKLEARVKCEHNDNLVSPLDPVRAEWKPAADDEAAAAILLQHIQARLQPELELKPEPAPPAKRP